MIKKFLRELIQLMRTSDESLDNFISNSAKNATYVSKTIQNEVLDITKKMIIKKVIDEVRESRYCCIHFDETTDNSRLSQLCVLIRHIFIIKF